MRYFVILIFIAAATSISATRVVGQARTVTEADLTKLISEATQKRKGLPQRQRTSTTGYAAGDSSETLSEFGPDDTYHYVVIRRSKGAETRTEGIRIRGVRYTWQKDGSWIKELPQDKAGGGGDGFGSGSGSAQTSKPETTDEYLYLGKEKIDGKKTEHYRKVHVVRFTSRTPVLTRRFVDDYWFGADGLLAKESREETLGNGGRRYTRVTTYEYDKNIRITAPIPD